MRLPLNRASRNKNGRKRLSWLLWLAVLLFMSCGSEAPTPPSDLGNQQPTDLVSEGDAVAPEDQAVLFQDIEPDTTPLDASLDVGVVDLSVQDTSSTSDVEPDLVDNETSLPDSVEADVVDTVVLPDMDDDDVPDIQDNCPETPNTDQSDIDDDGTGDVCDGDKDGDMIPNDKDGWPEDGDMPGIASMETVYAHTDDTLYSMEVGTTQVWVIGMFDFSPLSSDQITDIAIDQYGVIYATSFTKLYTCHPQTAKCTFLANLSGSYNGLTFVPGPNFGEAEDVLIGISNSGNWVRMDVIGTQVTNTTLGSYGSLYKSSGDSFSIDGVGTFASVEKICPFPQSCPDDYLVRVDPTTGTVLEEIGTIGTLKAVYGLAGWSGEAYAFDAMGSIYRVDLATGETELWVSTGETWWGAGVRTRL